MSTSSPDYCEGRASVGLLARRRDDPVVPAEKKVPSGNFCRRELVALVAQLVPQRP
jgi:hypothetical protein